jgi:hypothetical protein
MTKRSFRRFLKALIGAPVAAALLTGAALALTSYTYTTVYGTPGPDSINERGQNGNFHIYGFQGSDSINSGNGNITSSGQINGYDLIYGDGACTMTPPNNDSYCEHPFPWLRQPWTDRSSQGDSINDGNGPSWLIGGGGSNSINAGRTYDVMVGGPHNNSLNASALGSAVIAIYGNGADSINLRRTYPNITGLDGLKGTPNSADVYNPTRSQPASLNCSSTSNHDVVWANVGDSVNNCYTVYYPGATPASCPSRGTNQSVRCGAAFQPCFPDGNTYPSGNPCAAGYPTFTFPLSDFTGHPFARDVRRARRHHGRRSARHHHRSPRHKRATAFLRN